MHSIKIYLQDNTGKTVIGVLELLRGIKMPKKKKCTFRIPCGTVHKTIDLLQTALLALEADIDDALVEKIGVMVHRAYEHAE